jgi:hypothetical protein
MSTTIAPTQAERLRFALQTLDTPQRHLEALAESLPAGKAADCIQRALRSLASAETRIMEAGRAMSKPRSQRLRGGLVPATVIDTYTRAWDDAMHRHPVLQAGMLVHIAEGADAREYDAFQRRLRDAGCGPDHGMDGLAATAGHE